MIVASITATAIIHLFDAAALCCGGEELSDGAAAIAVTRTRRRGLPGAGLAH